MRLRASCTLQNKQKAKCMRMNTFFISFACIFTDQSIAVVDLLLLVNLHCLISGVSIFHDLENLCFIVATIGIRRLLFRQWSLVFNMEVNEGGSRGSEIKLLVGLHLTLPFHSPRQTPCDLMEV